VLRSSYLRSLRIRYTLHTHAYPRFLLHSAVTLLVSQLVVSPLEQIPVTVVSQIDSFSAISWTVTS